MAAAPDDPALLIHQAARSDDAAFGRFYDRFASLVFAFALRLLRARPEAEDPLQEVFVQAWRQAASYRPERGSPEAWLLTITRSRGIDKLRSIRRRDGIIRPSAELASFEGLTQTEIAVCLGEPLGTIKTRMRPGLERLRESHAVRSGPR
jgi:RNA polymerase sigma-70 factor (ECF subfamily)